MSVPSALLEGFLLSTFLRVLFRSIPSLRINGFGQLLLPILILSSTLSDSPIDTQGIVLALQLQKIRNNYLSVFVPLILINFWIRIKKYDFNVVSKANFISSNIYITVMCYGDCLQIALQIARENYQKTYGFLIISVGIELNCLRNWLVLTWWRWCRSW